MTRQIAAPRSRGGSLPSPRPSGRENRGSIQRSLEIQTPPSRSRRRIRITGAVRMPPIRAPGQKTGGGGVRLPQSGAARREAPQSAGQIRRLMRIFRIYIRGLGDHLTEASPQAPAPGDGAIDQLLPRLMRRWRPVSRPRLILRRVFSHFFIPVIIEFRLIPC